MSLACLIVKVYVLGRAAVYICGGYKPILETSQGKNPASTTLAMTLPAQTGRLAETMITGLVKGPATGGQR